MNLMQTFRQYLLQLRNRLNRRREEGVALISAIVMIAVISATTADFAYDAQVELAAATNARDELRAHYLARSAINISRMLLHLQKKLVEPNKKHLGGMDIQLADYASLITSMFASEEGGAALGGLLGLEEGAEVKGLGVDLGTFDIEMESLDGKLNLNCGGGANSGAPAVTRLVAGLAGLMLPERYNRLFQEPREDGQYLDRQQTISAILDWIDQDTVVFGSTAAEDYGYRAKKVPYEIKNQYFDSLEELRLVHGVNDDFMSAFANAFTVYGSCRVNVSVAEAPLIGALIQQFASNPSDPALRYENLALLARTVVYVRDLMGGFADADAFIKVIEDPGAQLGVASAVENILGQSGADQDSGLPQVIGVAVQKNKLKEAITAGTERRIWRMTGRAEVGRVRKKIVAVWDTKFISNQARRTTTGPGGFLYWREE